MNYFQLRNPRDGESPGRRLGMTLLELEVALVVFAIAMTGLYPLVIMQSKQLRQLEGLLQPQTTYFLVPSTDEWARKLGAVATVQTQDPGPAPTPPVLTIDNGDTGYSESGGGWNTDLQTNAYQGSLRWCAQGDGANVASWQFTGLALGWYDVQATWLEDSNRADDAPFTIFDGTQSKGTVTVNQQQAPSGVLYNGRPWQSLNKLAIGNTNVTVTLSDAADGRVIADGVRLVPLRNVVTVLSLERTLTSEEVTAHVSVTVQVPP